MLSDGLAFICAVTAANCHNKAVVTGGTPGTCRSSAGLTPCWATSRPALAEPSTPSNLTSTQGALSLTGRLLLSLQSSLPPGTDNREDPAGHLQLHRKARTPPEACGACYLIKTQLGQSRTRISFLLPSQREIQYNELSLLPNLSHHDSP